MSELSVSKRLIVAIDPPMVGYDEVAIHVETLATKLCSTNVVIKLNSALRLCGYSLLGMVAKCGLSTFADLKLCDIGDTMAKDASLLAEYSPSMLTVMINNDTPIGDLAMMQGCLPNTKVFGVPKLSTSSERDPGILLYRAEKAQEAGLSGLVCSGSDIAYLKRCFPKMMLVATNVRPGWAEVENDGQPKAGNLTPAEALQAGADYLVVGRPITEAQNPVVATMRVLQEMTEAVSTISA